MDRAEGEADSPILGLLDKEQNFVLSAASLLARCSWPRMGRHKNGD
jgi:hypothetical protein